MASLADADQGELPRLDDGGVLVLLPPWKVLAKGSCCCTHIVVSISSSVQVIFLHPGHSWLTLRSATSLVSIWPSALAVPKAREAIVFSLFRGDS